MNVRLCPGFHKEDKRRREVLAFFSDVIRLVLPMTSLVVTIHGAHTEEKEDGATNISHVFGGCFLDVKHVK